LTSVAINLDAAGRAYACHAGFPNVASRLVNAPLIAIISKEWKQRMQVLSLALAGVGAWFIYDGFIGYPNNNVRAAVYEQLAAQPGKEGDGLQKAWADAARERQWSDDKPKPTYTAGDMRTQIILGLAAWLGAAACLFHYFKSLPLTTRLEGGVIFLPNGTGIALTQIQRLSKKRWENKGIADLFYEAAPGKTKRFILDDYKFIGTAPILDEVEKFLASQDTP